MSLVQLTFESTLLHGHEPGLAGIYRRGRMRNQVNHITGILMCSGCFVIEVMEGDHLSISATYDRIQKHTLNKITSHKMEIIQKRYFSRWNTAYRVHENVTWDDQTTLYDVFNFDGIEPNLVCNAKSEVLDQLISFSIRYAVA